MEFCWLFFYSTQSHAELYKLENQLPTSLSLFARTTDLHALSPKSVYGSIHECSFTVWWIIPHLTPVNFKIAITGILFTLSTCYNNSDYQNAKGEGEWTYFPMIYVVYWQSFTFLAFHIFKPSWTLPDIARKYEQPDRQTDYKQS